MEAFKTFNAADKQLSTTVKTLNRKRRETKIPRRASRPRAATWRSSWTG